MRFRHQDLFSKRFELFGTSQFRIGTKGKFDPV